MVRYTKIKLTETNNVASVFLGKEKRDNEQTDKNKTVREVDSQHE
jgi:hypothetical protein